jgi:predicted DNA-binding transcriptional regulator AlpA
MSRKFLNARAVSTRYSGVSSRTIDRWIESGALPEPIYIQGQRYWPEDQLDEHDKARRSDNSANLPNISQADAA